MPNCATCNKNFEGTRRSKFCSPACQLQSKLFQPIGSECIEWVGAIGSHGYGVINAGGKPRTAHRISYEINVGSIPDGMYVLHSCDNRKCVNPYHLRLGTHCDNMRDLAIRERSPFKGKQRNKEQMEKLFAGRRVAKIVPSANQRIAAAKTLRKLWENKEFRDMHSLPNQDRKKYKEP